MAEWDFDAIAGQPMYFDRQGQPITLDEWAEHLRGEYKRVAQDYVIVDGEPLWLSTVWIGLDMSFDYRPGHIPIIFETMTFGHGGDADVQRRYPTEAAALAGHDRILAELTDPIRKGLLMDESESDDGALHALFQGLPLPVIVGILAALVRLSRVRGAVTPELRARAQALADDPLFSLAHHPVIRRILEAP